jgi:hypothetical protein
MLAEGTGPTWPDVKAAYWRNHRAVREQVQGRLAQRNPRQSDDGPDPDFWAWEYINALWRTGDRAALDRLVDLADSAPDADDLAYLGAGPVEDLVRVFGELLIDNIEEAARRSPSFLRALQGMYPTLIPESIRVRLLPLIPATSPENRVRGQRGKAPL